LVADLKAADAFGVDALRLYVEGVEDKVGEIEQAIKKINEDWGVLEQTIADLVDRMELAEQQIVDINEFLKDVPYVRITEDEIDKLDDLES
jgi:hypothetical protein